MKTKKRLDLALGLLAVMGILFFSGNAFAANLPAPMLGSPVNGKEFIRGKEDFFLEVINTNGSKYVEIWVDNNSGFGSPEIGYYNKQSPNYTGSDGIYLTGTNFVFTKALQNKVPKNVYFWKARLLDASKKPGDWSLVKNFTLENPKPKDCIINSISPTSKSFTYGAGSGSISVNVFPDGKNCARTAASNNSWISITSGASGTEDGTVNYSVSENTGASLRTGTISIITSATNTQNFPITQEGKSTYSWQTSSWGSCSECCGNGSKTRNVWCERNDGSQVGDSYCSGAKPSASQSCSDSSCCVSYTWQKSSWSACSAECGNGNKTRNVWCQRNDGQTVSDSYCSASGAKPNASDSCFQSCSPKAEITLLSPNPAKKGEYVIFIGNGSDPDGGKVSYKWSSDISGELSQEASFTNYSLSAGEHIITLQVIDDESSTAIAQKTLTVTEAINLIPSVRITSHDNGHKVASIKVKISGIASDDDGSISKVQVKVNDGDWTDAQGTTSWSKDISLEEGANTVSCRAFDDKNAESSTYSITLNCEISQKDKAIELKDEEIASASIGKGEEQLYFIDVPNTATAIVIKTEGTSGKVVNLYLNRDAIPTVDDCYLKSTRSDGEEKFRIDASGSDTASGQTEDTFRTGKGRYYVLVKPDSNGGNYSIRARYLELRFPFVGDYKITQGYNEPLPNTHHGTKDCYALDFAYNCNDYGRLTVASEKARVAKVTTELTDSIYGRSVKLDYGDGYTTLHGHFSTLSVREEITVQKGQEIGTFGNTGNCYSKNSSCSNLGTHQHFVLRKDGKAIIPEPMSGKTDFKLGDKLTGEEVSNPETFMVVDDTEAKKEGTATFTTHNQIGYKDTMQSVNGAGIGAPASASMTWTPDIIADGNYKVYAHIPKANATAKVVYHIIHNGKAETKEVNQGSVDNNWVMLTPKEGFSFTKLTESCVKLNNSNIPTDKKVGFDAIMFTAIEYGPMGGEATPSPELCDGLDNDSNGEIDEGFDVGSSCAVGTGACERIGYKVCSDDGATTVCDAVAGNPSPEICDLLDNDCDAEIDESFDVGASCSVGIGACQRTGKKVCSGNGTTTVCNTTAGSPSAEICCDGIDNNCDGHVDENTPPAAPTGLRVESVD